jgi:hypothetical protein
MKKFLKIGTIAIFLGLAGILIAGCSSSTTTKTATTAKKIAQLLPVAKNPIVNTATTPGLAITSAMVENNEDPVTKKALSDMLQITLENDSTTPMADFEIYYLMTDVTTKKTEGYYQKLTGLTLAAGETKTIYFDNGTGAGHFPDNKYSLYRSSKNEVSFDIQVSTAGFKPAIAAAKKSVGTTETQD